MFKRQGFTILELLIVIAVISIIIGIALPRFKGMQDEGNIAKAKGELRTLQTGVESYAIHNAGSYPATLAPLTTATPRIVGTMPKDAFKPASDYGYATSGGYYVIYSVGQGTNGSCTISSAGSGTVTETNDAIYVTNGSNADTTP